MQQQITVAYEDDLELRLDSSSRGVSMLQVLDDLVRLTAATEGHVHLTEDEAARIIRSAAALIEVNAGTVAECLDTALVWERG